MPIPLLRKSAYIFFLLIAFHFLVIQTSYASEKHTGDVSGLQKLAGELKAKGYYDKAIPIIKEVLALKRETLGGNNADVAQCLDLLGELHYLAGKYPEAEPFLKESLSIRMELFGSNHIETAESFEHLGTLYALMAEYANAVKYLNDALKIRETTYGKDHPDVAETLVTLARVQIDKDNYDKTEPLLNRALAIQEKSLGPEHPDLTRTLNTLAWMHIDTDDFEKAESFSRRALEISEKAFGPEHPYVADSLNYLGRLYSSRREYDKSIETNKRALVIREKFLGPDHPDVGLSLNNLALPYCSLNKYDTAKSLFIRSLSIREKTLGPEHPYLRVILANLGWTDQVLGDYEGAVYYFKRSLAISEKTLNPDDPKIARILRDLAELYYKLGQYSKAEPLFKKFLEINERTLDPGHPRIGLSHSYLGFISQFMGDNLKAESHLQKAIKIAEMNFDNNPENFANSLSNLALMYADSGEYKKAEPLYLRALDILEKTHGPEHSSVAPILHNLATLYSYLNNLEKAEALYQRALAIWEKTVGPEHLNTASSLNRLAMLYEEAGAYEKAESLYSRALKIQEKILVPNHPDVLRTLNNLATIYSFSKDLTKAEQLHKRVLKIKKDTTGTETETYANSLINLATLYKAQRNYAKAEPLYNQAIEIYKKTLGSEHPKVAIGLGLLSVLYEAMGDFEKAYDFITRTLEIEDMLLDQVMGFTSEDQKLKFVSTNNWSLYDFLNLVNQHLRQNPGKRKNALNVWLKRKGSILEVQKRYQEAIFSGGNPESAKLFEELSAVRSSLSKLTFAQPGKEDEKSYKQKKDDLKNKKDRLEASLSRLSQPFAMNQKIAKADCEKIAKMLIPQTALVEFARMEGIKSENKDKLIFSARYISFVLHSGDGNRISMVDLGDAAIIDKMVTQYKKEIYASGTEKSDAVTETSRKLYDLVFRPLLKHLGTVKEIFISPDGNLNLMPFEVLQGPDGRFLIEDYTFNYLAAGRDIIGFGKNPVNSGKYLLMGDPDFNLGPGEKMAFLKRSNIKNDMGTLVATRSTNLNEVSFEPLHYAKEELNAIGGIMGQEKSEIYTGEKALEEILMNKPGPEILHLATHGFFLNKYNLPSSGRGWQTADLPDKDKNPSGRTDRVINVENPLLRSGILLAGAKRSLMSGDMGNNDGILTAEKILGLNLHGTNMVVLSACDTGLGEVESGEGVFGLRRAFTQAGAKSLVMSLWKVPDMETKELMVQFYRNIKSGSMNRCHALRQAILAQMKIVKQRQGDANPRYWGAFVFMGEP
ncbi:MAG: tetratricopeptide repeat protein [Pseudomonadota bacterium]